MNYSCFFLIGLKNYLFAIAHRMPKNIGMIPIELPNANKIAPKTAPVTPIPTTILFIILFFNKYINCFLINQKLYIDNMKYLKLYENFKSFDISSPERFCEKYKIENYTIENGVINVDGNVELSFKKLESLPFKFGSVTGSFNISGNELTTLENCPDEVGGSYNISDNKVKSLEGCPDAINNGSFDCGYNLLETLVGGPRYVSSNYICKENHLKTLEGAPEIIPISFICNENLLKSLQFCPREVGGYFDCSENKIKSLVGGPNTKNGYDCSHNELVNLEGVPRELNSLYCGHNLLTTLEGGPDVIHNTLKCNHNKLTTLDGIPSKLVHLDCSSNQIYKIEGLKEISDLFIKYNPFQVMWNIIGPVVSKDYTLLELFNEYDIIRDPGYDGVDSTKRVQRPVIILDRLNSFLDDIGLETIDNRLNNTTPFGSEVDYLTSYYKCI